MFKIKYCYIFCSSIVVLYGRILIERIVFETVF